jgi:uncharacterized protein (TIGR03118 family)
MKVTPASTGTLAYVLNCSTPTGSIAQSATLTVTAMAAPGSARHLVPGREEVRVRRTDLVADVTGTRALRSDVNLSDPWGVALSGKLPAVVASRRSNSSISYDGVGGAYALPAPPLLHLPDSTRGVAFGAAGVVSNLGDGFIVSSAGKSAPAQLLYAGRSGVIAAWSPEVDTGAALSMFAADDSAAYTGLAIATSSTPSESHLYAADFRNGRIDVFDTAFRRQTPTSTKFAFADPALPPGYAPFGIALIDDLVYVAYAQRSPTSFADPVSGPGLGMIGVFTPRGDFITRLVAAGGVLDAPWAIVRAPAGGGFAFGREGRALLVGNTGDGTINAFDPATGTLLGSLTDERGAVLVIPRLHGLAFGNDCAAQPQTTLFFSAGAYGGAHGWYGRLDRVASPERAGR